MSCGKCIYENCSIIKEPCSSCVDNSNFKPQEEKTKSSSQQSALGNSEDTPKNAMVEEIMDTYLKENLKITLEAEPLGNKRFQVNVNLYLKGELVSSDFLLLHN